MTDDEAARWEHFGREHPYYAVLVDERYRGRSLGEAAHADFFATGEAHVARLCEQFAALLGAPVKLGRVLDLGCGVGRLTLPLARRATEAVGVDIAEPLLVEARKNAARLGVTNATFVRSDAALSRVEGSFDAVHSYITFQHIHPRAGIRLMARMLTSLAPGGIGMLHTTFRRRAPLYRKAGNWVRDRSRAVNGIVNRIQGREAGEPFIPMHNYDRRAVVRLLADHGCTLLLELETDHGGHLGAMLYFSRAQ